MGPDAWVRNCDLYGAEHWSRRQLGPDLRTTISAGPSIGPDRSHGGRDLDFVLVSEREYRVMWTTIKAILESRKFVAAILTAIAMSTARIGWHIDVSLLLMFATPIMVAIGAQGWADSGKEAAQITADAAVKMHAMTTTRTTTITPSSGTVAVTIVPAPAPAEVSTASELVGKVPVVIALLLAGVVLGAAPGCGASQRTNAIHASVIAVDAARDGFVAYDAAHQHQIVDQATSLETGRADLAAYRAKRDPVVNAFIIAYRALALAATQTDDPSLTAALAKAAELLQSIEKLKGGS